MLRELTGFIDPVLYNLPLWLAGLLLIAACLLALVAGSALQRYRSQEKSDGSPARKAEATSHVISAIFGMLAFLLGITFSIAVDRYDGRRALVAAEASAISNAYMRSSLFDDPDRARLQGLLRQYAHSRIAPEGLWNQHMEDRVKEAQALRVQLWDATQEAAYPVRTTQLSALLVDAMNDMFTISTRREITGRAHIPTRILDVLGLYLLVSSGALGYLIGPDIRGRRFSGVLIITLFATLIILIIDLDRPQSGTIKISQRALEEMSAALDRDAERTTRAHAGCGTRPCSAAPTATVPP